MSTLNTFGFNVRRMRNNDTTPSITSQPDKLSPSIDTSPPTPVFAFAATSPESINTHTQPAKPFIASLPKHSTTKSKSMTMRSTTDPKQSTLLNFFTIPTSPISTLPSTERLINTTDTRSLEDEEEDHTPSIQQQRQQQIQPTPLRQCQQNELCYVRRTIDTVDILVALEEAFGVSTYGSIDGDDILLFDEQRHKQPQHSPLTTAIPLLQVKSNKVIYPPLLKMMDCSNNNEFREDSVIINQRRRRSLENEQVNKRLCSVSFSETKQQQYAYWIMDEFSGTQQQDNIEIKEVRHCLSSVEMTSLLLDIANEIMTFEDNNWCNSYFDHHCD